MKAFIESPAHQFVKSRLTARASRDCPLDSETSDTWIHRRYWSVQPVLCGWQGYQDYTHTVEPLSDPGFGTIVAAGSNYDAKRQWYAIQGGYTDIPRGSTSGINFRSRGKWKVDSTLRVFRAKVAHAASPYRHWLFFNLTRRAKDYSVTGSNSDLEALIRHVSGPVVLPSTPTLTTESELIGGTPDEGVPANAIPGIGSNPDDVLCTWKIDASSVTASPSSPYVFTDTLIVPETLDFCRVMFDVTPYEFGDSEQTIGTNDITAYPSGACYVVSSNANVAGDGYSRVVYGLSLTYLTVPEGATVPTAPTADLSAAYEFFDTYGLGTREVWLPTLSGADVPYTNESGSPTVVHGSSYSRNAGDSLIIYSGLPSNTTNIAEHASP